MNFKPILFSTPMVRAILKGRKTQTRRIIKTVLDNRGLRFCNGYEDWHGNSIKCPYGAIGDVLWVREEHYLWGCWEDVPDIKTPTGKQKRRFVDKARRVLFPNTFGNNVQADRNDIGWHMRLARFMPRKYTRLFLQVTDIRVERLQDISEEDCVSEGIEYADSYYPRPPDGHLPPLPWKNYQTDGECLLPIDSYSSLWKEINGEESWHANPWVWAITFKRIDKPADFIGG